MKGRLFFAFFVGATSLSTTQMASAHDWYGGDCAYYYNNNGTGACIEYIFGSNSRHIGTDKTSGNFEGPFSPEPVLSDGTGHTGSMENFRFVGTADLTCVSTVVTASCTLELDGRVGLNGSTVNIDINQGSVTGGGLCSSITLKNFSWYIAPDSSHNTSNFYPGGGIVVSGTPPYVGAVGSIGLTVKDPVFGVTLVDITNSHIHGVSFDNNGNSASSFTFTSEIYKNGGGSTGCNIDGALYVAGGKDININY